MRIIGTRGQIDFITFKLIPIEPVTVKETASFEYKRPEHMRQNLIEKIVDEMRG